MKCPKLKTNNVILIPSKSWNT